ncbi:hypothetical protein QFZ80_001524 [Paenibacillus sp. V4I7]|nr:hypothetical protein [Paenibacillus sp. V4I7]MDQ0916312.1 hypothetical protein [Paenibacillus sp. V4I5]
MLRGFAQGKTNIHQHMKTKPLLTMGGFFVYIELLYYLTNDVFY